MTRRDPTWRDGVANLLMLAFVGVLIIATWDRPRPDWWLASAMLLLLAEFMVRP